ncbi:tRNA-guanine transglycosylase family protein [Aspergillus sclerotioniger CBS 115572]|uniref:Queuine tRNA-ribosyltransferase accessory subunit 2 n=1 Tax=Aspergillus sclerotioniger CBS 115572 TaxID=1450535 RepID=A0A317WIZ3_9EURO|nr:tRNA-guanine transglycosylase family protein [Aspergillus sclerotioniger CBS 115572]PWY86426.1 tRNA-guanine transglycosylase family protein [Aspergillus sclerotioniger CBS 115572]
MGSESSPQPSNEMLAFHATASILTPRVGTLALAGRKAISTPHYIPLASRGVVPHIAHDVMRDNTAIRSLFVGLEDFVERQSPKNPPPVYKTPTAQDESALRKFAGLPDDLLLIIGARREPPIKCPPSNTPNSVAIYTSVGFRQLEAGQYINAVQKLKPDIVVGLADLVLGHTPGTKRRGKMVDRTHAFTTHATGKLYGSAVPEENQSKAAYFAPVLPLDNAQQSIYIDDLESELRPYISGLALYESASLSAITEPLGDLPRLLFSAPATPHAILREISLGADLLTIPFIGVCSDAGIALDFTFPSTPNTTTTDSQPRHLAFDLWSPSYTTDTSPLSESCQCYTCCNHHRAYIHHLLTTKEMLAWTLLQIHNYHAMDLFFADIRQSIARGTFEADTQTFQRAYVSELPEPTGQGPRLRGYQLPASGPHQTRRNTRAYGKLDDAMERFAESQSSLATPDTGAEGLEEHGFGTKEKQ